jgi:hypothetical protein
MATFAVYWIPEIGSMIEEVRGATPEKALATMTRLALPPSNIVVKRAYMVCEQDDSVTLDWTAADGITFPTADSHPAPFKYYSQLMPKRQP